jgi:hypothetical protein
MLAQAAGGWRGRSHDVARASRLELAIEAEGHLAAQAMMEAWAIIQVSPPRVASRGGERGLSGAFGHARLYLWKLARPFPRWKLARPFPTSFGFQINC